MSIKNLMETKVPEFFSKHLYSIQGYDLAAEHTDKILDTAVSGITACLHDLKSKDYPVCFKISKSDDSFIIAAIVEYFANEDDASKPGNWNYTWTFNKEDVPENAKIVTPYDMNLMNYFSACSRSKYGFLFSKPQYMGDIFQTIFYIISQYLSDNASDSEENGVKMDGVIEFRCKVEDGVTIKSAEVDGEIKQRIKDDAAIEK